MRVPNRNLIYIGLLVAVVALIPTCTLTFGPSIVLWDWPSTNEFRRTVAGADRVVVNVTDHFTSAGPSRPCRRPCSSKPSRLRFER